MHAMTVTPEIARRAVSGIHDFVETLTEAVDLKRTPSLFALVAMPKLPGAKTREMSGVVEETDRCFILAIEEIGRRDNEEFLYDVQADTILDAVAREERCIIQYRRDSLDESSAPVEGYAIISEGVTVVIAGDTDWVNKQVAHRVLWVLRQLTIPEP